ncbi:MAG: metallophosphoesterase [Methylococcaceae bacterium]
MKIHVLSDLHIEFEPFTPSLAANEADVVVLAGDIGIKTRGIEWARRAFSCPVIYVAGNHEFYGGHLDGTLEKMRAAACDQVRVLDNDEWIFNGLRFLGTTAWTDYTATGNSMLAKYEAQNGLNDFRKIRTGGYRKIRPDDLAQLNYQSFTWLRDRIAEPFDGTTVVVTHHAPSMVSLGHARIEDADYVERWRKIMGNSDKIGSTCMKDVSHLDASYANSWESLMGGSVALWVHGHTHQAVDYEINGTLIICNPRGYPGDEIGFNPDLLVEI